MGITSLLSDPGGFLKTALYSLPAILIALSFHEWGHAYAAYRLGDPTARNLGRMTVNPLAHIDPVGFVCLLLFRFGWAKPVPVNPRNFKNFRKDDIIVSLAGVTVNAALGIIGFIVIYLYAVLQGANSAIAMMLFYFCYINFALMTFNLIPIPPLDGSHVLESLLIRRVGPKPFYFLARYGNYILIALIVSGVTSTILGTVVNGVLSGLEVVFDKLFGYPGLVHIYYLMMGY